MKPPHLENITCVRHSQYFYTIHQVRRFLRATMFICLFSGAFFFYFIERYLF